MEKVVHELEIIITMAGVVATVEPPKMRELQGLMITSVFRG